MKYRTLPQKFLDRIRVELETIPVVKGKVSLTFEFNSDTAGQMNILGVKKYFDDQERTI